MQKRKFEEEKNMVCLFRTLVGKKPQICQVAHINLRLFIRPKFQPAGKSVPGLAQVVPGRDGGPA